MAAGFDLKFFSYIVFIFQIYSFSSERREAKIDRCIFYELPKWIKKFDSYIEVKYWIADKPI